MRTAHRVASSSRQARDRDRDHRPLTGAIDYPLLISFGWEPTTATFSPDRDDPLFGYPVCRVLGCEHEAWDPIQLCTGCQNRFKTDKEIDIEAFLQLGPLRTNHSRDRRCLVCRIPGYERPVGTNDLCLSCDGRRRRYHQNVKDYVHGDDQHPPAKPRPSLGVCTVTSCQRLVARPLTDLCGAHDAAWRRTGRPDLTDFRSITTPCIGDRSGRVVLAGLSENVIAEVLYGIQIARTEGRRVMPSTLRSVVTHLRNHRAQSVADVIESAPTRTPVRWFCSFVADRVALISSDVESEWQKDVWDLRLWGASGRLSFIGGGMSRRYGKGEPTRSIRQVWLKEAAKTWAAESLLSMTPGPVRAVIGAVGLFSEHLARRDDSGNDPTALSHRDIEAFLARLKHLEQAGQLSKQRREKKTYLLARFLRDCREMDFDQRDATLASLPDDVVIRAGERPRTTRSDDEVGLALPEGVMTQLLSSVNLAHLEDLAGATIRAAVELSAGVGRRTAELCALRFSCLDYDEHTGEGGERRTSPVLIHDMPKVGRVSCRLPIHDREKTIISLQQARVRAAFPDTPIEQLALFPRPLKNPGGRESIGTSHLQRAMRAWVTALDHLDGPDKDSTGRAIPFPRERVFPYAFRHSFAQRHADAGTPVDTLRELLGHDTVRTTLGYYRVTAKRKRDAQDTLGPLQLDAVGQRVRSGTAGLVPSEALREQIGQVAIPFGVCTEPANVSANGQSCPFRHRCFGCTYFRTDPSYQPELRGYLAQLLTDRERLTAADPQLTDWARSEATPSTGEIEAVRHLIAANEKVLTTLDAEDRQVVGDAITTMRSARAALEVTYPVHFRGLVRQAKPILFPTIERESQHDPAS